jgi:hypothetical protein
VSWRTKSPRNFRQIGWAEQGNVFKPLAQDPSRSVSVVVRAVRMAVGANPVEVVRFIGLQAADPVTAA